MRCVVEGQPPHEMSDEEDGEEEKNEWQAKAGVVYRLVKGQLKVLDRGMGQYEAIAEKAAGRSTRLY